MEFIFEILTGAYSKRQTNLTTLHPLLDTQIDDDLNLEREKRYLANLPEGATKLPPDMYKDPSASLTPGWDEDDEDLLVESEEEKLKKRTKEILQTVLLTNHIMHNHLLVSPLFAETSVSVKSTVA